MTAPNSNEEKSWGLHLNTRWAHHVKSFPAWLRKSQQKSWAEKGLVVWDETAGSVTHLTGNQVLQIYQQLQSSTDWLQEGFLIGEPAYHIPLDQGKSAEGRWVLTNTTQLAAEQAQKVFDFIRENLGEFEKIAEEEKEERSRVLAQVYSFLLRDAEAKKDSQADQEP